MAGSDSRDLTRAEQSYVAQVRYQLRHLPRDRQHTMLKSVRRTLLSETPIDTYARLEREMGTPAGYAARLLGRGEGGHDEASRPASARAGSGSTATLWAALVVVVAIAVVAAVVLATR